MGNHAGAAVISHTVEDRSGGQWSPSQNATAFGPLNQQEKTMNLYAITYEYSGSTASRRDEVRSVHVEFLQECFNDGRLLVSGPVDDGAGALLIITGNDESDAVGLMDDDPVFQNTHMTHL